MISGYQYSGHDQSVHPSSRIPRKRAGGGATPGTRSARRGIGQPYPRSL